MYKINFVMDGTEYPLKRVNFFVTRDRDKDGRPVSRSAWTLLIAINTTTDDAFTEWMVDAYKKKDVSLKFYKGDDPKKEWQFQQAYCIGFEENFIADAGVMQTILIVSGQTVNNGNATLTYDWQV